MHTYSCHLCCPDLWFCLCINQSKPRTLSTLLAVTSYTLTKWSLFINMSAWVQRLQTFLYLFVLTARLVVWPTHPIHHGPSESIGLFKWHVIATHPRELKGRCGARAREAIGILLLTQPVACDTQSMQTWDDMDMDMGMTHIDMA